MNNMIQKNKKESEEKIGKKDLVEVEKITTDLIKAIGVDVKTEVLADKKNNAILVNIDTEKEKGLLIGARGETLLALQSIISMMFQSKTQKWIRIFVNIADWREKEEERLNKMAKQIADRARTSGQTQSLYNLNSNQRRIIHTALSEEEGIKTESLGEGKDRYLTVKAI